MKLILLTTVSSFFALAGSAYAGIPMLNATCPTGIEIHADQGGPIYINGKEAALKTLNSKAYEAKHGHVTISLTINPDGSPLVSYTKDGGATGICTLADNTAAGPSEVAKGACLFKMGVDAAIVQTSALKPGYWEIIMKAKSGNRRVACTVDNKGNVEDWVKMK
jgi:hypothetical protein